MATDITKNAPKLPKTQQKQTAKRLFLKTLFEDTKTHTAE